MHVRMRIGALGLAASLVMATAQGQTVYTWTGDAGDGEWNHVSANWTLDGDATPTAWVDGNIARFSHDAGGTNTLTRDIDAYGLAFTVPWTLAGSGGLRKLKVGAGGITGPDTGDVVFDTHPDALQVVITADQTWRTGAHDFRFAPQLTSSAIATATEGLVLTITSTGGHGLRNFGSHLMRDFNGTIRAEAGALMFLTRLHEAGNVVFDLVDNPVATPWTAAPHSPTAIAGLINGVGASRAHVQADSEVVFSGTNTYVYAGRLGPDNRVRKRGAGTQMFTGELDHTGETTIEAGALRINGSHVNATNYTVKAGGTLGGAGTIHLVDAAILTVEDGGVLDPGAYAGAVGTLTIDGDVTLAEGAVYRWDVEGRERVDRLDVTGTLTLPAVATLIIIPAPDARLQRETPLITFVKHAGATDLSGWTIQGGSGKDQVVLGDDRVLLQAPPPDSLLRLP